MKDEIKERIRKCHIVLEQSTGWSLWGNTRVKFNSLIDEVSALEMRLANNTQDDELIKIKRDAIKLESRAISFRTYRMSLPYVFYTYVSFTMIFVFINYVDIPRFINSTLGVNAPEKLISFGIAGALLFLATSILSKSSGNGPMGSVSNFAVRLLMAVIAPIIFVALFFTSEGAIYEITITPELLSFVVGYSANLVIEALNKLVEKASSMIQAL